MARTDRDLDPVAPSVDGAAESLGAALAGLQADIADSLCVPLRLLTGPMGAVVDEVDAYVRTVSQMQKAMTRGMWGSQGAHPQAQEAAGQEAGEARGLPALREPRGASRPGAELLCEGVAMSALAGAIERKARELGVWTVVGTGELLRACERGEWFMCDGLAGRGPGFSVGRSGGEWQLGETAAALWLLVMEAGHTIEQSCPACAERGGGWQRRRDLDGRFEGRPHLAAHSGWLPLEGPLDFGFHRMWTRPCPTCAVDGEPTGRVHTPAHEVMLGALPSFDVSEHTMAALFDIEQKQPLREDIEVLATRLELQGDPLGTLLALWLAGKLEERHVLGVETVSGDRMLLLSVDPHSEFHWAIVGPCEGWTLDSYVPGAGLSVASWRRPTLEANP